MSSNTTSVNVTTPTRETTSENPIPAETPNPFDITIDPDTLEISILSDQIEAETSFLQRLPEPVKNSRQTFINAWDQLVEFERSNSRTSVGGHTDEPVLTRAAQSQKRKELFFLVHNNLKIYTYNLFKKELGTSKVISKETCAKASAELHDRINQLGGDPTELIHLLTKFTAAHGKDLEFRSKLNRTLQQELLYKHINHTQQIRELEDEILKVEKSGERKLNKVQTDLSKQLVDAQLIGEELKKELEAHKETILKQGVRIGELRKPLTGDDKETDTDTKLRKSIVATDELREQLHSAFEQQEQLRAELETTQKDYDVLYNEKSDLEHQYSTAEKQIQVLQDTLKKQQDLSTQLESNIAWWKDELELVEDKNKQRNVEIVRLGDQIRNYQAEIAQLTTAKQESEDNKRLLETSNQYLQGQLQNVSQAHSSDVQTLQDNIQQLSDEAHQKDQEITDLRNQLTGALNQLSVAQRQANSMAPHGSPPPPTNSPGTSGTGSNQTTPPNPNADYVWHIKSSNAREEKKLIPLFMGTGDDTLISDWIEEAERIATNNRWTPEEKVRFFSDRLKDDAIEWHKNHLEKHALDDYDGWKKSLIEAFSDATDLENRRQELNNLKQKATQRTRAFVRKIDSLYDKVYGKMKTPTPNHSAVEITLLLDIKNKRDKEKKDILMKGLLDKFKQEMWPKMFGDEPYDQVCEIAYGAEKLLVQKEITKDRGVDTVIANISLHEGEQDKEIKMLKARLAEMEELLKTNYSAHPQEPFPTIAAVSTPHRDRSASNGRPYRSNSQVQFKVPLSRSHSIESNYQDRNSYERGRSTDRRQNSGNPNYRATGRSPGYRQAKPHYNHPQRTHSTDRNQGQRNVQHQNSNDNARYSKDQYHQSNQGHYRNQQSQQFQTSTHQQGQNWQPQSNQNGGNPRYLGYNNQGGQQRPHNPNIECHYCHKLGHVRRQCPEFLRQHGRSFV